MLRLWPPLCQMIAPYKHRPHPPLGGRDTPTISSTLQPFNPIIDCTRIPNCTNAAWMSYSLRRLCVLSNKRGLPTGSSSNAFSGWTSVRVVGASLESRYLNGDVCFSASRCSHTWHLRLGTGSNS